MALIPYERQFTALNNGFLKDFFGERFAFAAGPLVKTDVKETDEAFIVEAEMPGVKKEDVTLVCEKGILTISAKTSEEKTEEKENYVRKERFSGEAKRSFALKNINEEEISAKLEDGVLYVTLPKKEQDKEKRIEIE